MRARLALLVSGQVCELRDVVLKQKPDELLQASPKATVPVLVLADGQVLDQSLDIMRWALRRHDPQNWLLDKGEALDAALNWVARCDTDFKPQLDRYKYPHRFGLVDATPAQIKAAAADTIPNVAPIFWSFRIMVGLGMLFLFIFSLSFYFLARRNLAPQRWLLRLAVLSIPLPWVAIEAGWLVAEYGRQPWTISGILPTFMSASALSVGQLHFSMIGLGLMYCSLFAIEMYLMLKYIRLGPASLHTGRYFGEQTAVHA